MKLSRKEAIEKVAPRLSHIHNMEIPKKIKWVQDLIHECYDSFDEELKKQKIWGMRKRDEAHKFNKELQMTVIKCDKCGSTKIKHFLEIKGKNAKLECICGNIYWTDIK